MGYKQDTANQGNIQRNAVNLSNETGESTKKADLKEEDTTFRNRKRLEEF